MKNKFKIHNGKIIKFQRKKLGLTQVELGRKIGLKVWTSKNGNINCSQIARWESMNPETPLNPDSAIKLAYALKIPVLPFLALQNRGGTDEMQKLAGKVFESITKK